jgi:hypothetical protein
MVRKGSPVRVRQRALRNPLETGGFVVQTRLGAGPDGPLWKRLKAPGGERGCCRLLPTASGSARQSRRCSLPAASLCGGLRPALTGCPESLRASPGPALTFRGRRDPRSTASEGPGSPSPGCKPWLPAPSVSARAPISSPPTSATTARQLDFTFSARAVGLCRQVRGRTGSSDRLRGPGVAVRLRLGPSNVLRGEGLATRAAPAGPRHGARAALRF